MIRTPLFLLLPAALLGAVLPGPAGANSRDAGAARALELFVQRETAQMPGRVEIRVGATMRNCRPRHARRWNRSFRPARGYGAAPGWVCAAATRRRALRAGAY